MGRHVKTLLMTGVALAAVGLWTTGAMACDGAKKANAEQASAKKSCSSEATAVKASAGKSCGSDASAMKASAGSCASKATAAKAGSCGSKATAAKAGSCSKDAMASGACDYKKVAALGNMSAFAFVKDANECSDRVRMNVERTDNGFAFVFAAVNQDGVVEAKQLARKSFETMSKPAACAATRAAMADGGCDMTKACISALADAEIVIVETEDGAKTLVQSKDETKVKELHGFYASLTPAADESDS